eukprot:5375406-Pyramimonas_sp.AAC.1
MHGVLFPRASLRRAVFPPCAGAERPSTPGAARTEYSLTRTRRVFIFWHACSLFEDDFKLLGIWFDAKLPMSKAADSCAAECSWKMQRLLRARRFHTDAELI